jgi:putative two-component system response regulator
MRILISDDDQVVCQRLESIISKLGYETMVAADGSEAWQLWKTARPRIVVTDWMMPKMDGLELCRRIRECEKDQYTYIIVVTGKDGPLAYQRGLEAGADDFIVKPFLKEELSLKVRSGERVLSIESRDLVILAMAKLAESRDSETGNHLERIRFYCRSLAQTYMELNHDVEGLDQSFIDTIYLTSPLHDIGKIGIPDYILLKPGRLDDKEFEIMKNHCRIGYTSLNETYNKYPRADYLRMSAEIALSHHEKYDGTGYPEGLAGTAIPLSARITALADVYDALVTKRIYKHAYTHEMAKSIIMNECGKAFDPQVVEAFLACEKYFMDTALQLQD